MYGLLTRSRQFTHTIPRWWYSVEVLCRALMSSCHSSRNTCKNTHGRVGEHPGCVRQFWVETLRCWGQFPYYRKISGPCKRTEKARGCYLRPASSFNSFLDSTEFQSQLSSKRKLWVERFLSLSPMP